MMFGSKLAVAVMCDNKVLRERGDSVYLPFGSEFSLRIKNLNNRKVRVEVLIDGISVLGDRALIIDAFSDTELERFVSDGDKLKGRRFKFIEKTGAISEYRGNKIEDGLVEIRYTFEKEVINLNQGIFIKGNLGTTVRGGPVYGMNTGGYVGSNPSGVVGALNSSVQSNELESYTSAVCDCNFVEEVVPQNDAGITVPGSESTQRFQTGHIGTLESTKYSLVLQLKGDDGIEIIQEPLLARTKKTCSSCGSKISTKYEYCPYDGTYLGK